MQSHYLRTARSSANNEGFWTISLLLERLKKLQPYINLHCIWLQT